MKTLTFAVAALVLTAASPAKAWPGLGGCAPWVCGENGPQLSGLARSTLEATRPVVNAVTLPSGETVDRR